MIHVDIDELTPCLKDVRTGELVQTEVIRIKRKSFLKKYNKKNGWYTNWDSLVDEHEIYALVIAGTVDIQGLIAIASNDEMNAIYISWMCCSPDNNKLLTANIRYSGIGGHLFAIAVRKSIHYGYEGFLYGFAANDSLMQHYINTFHGEKIGILHPYHFAIDGKNAKSIMEVYDYEWVDEEL